MLLGMLRELTLDDFIMIDRLSHCLKESSGLSNWYLFTSSYHVGRRVIHGLGIKCGGGAMNSESVIGCVGGGGVNEGWVGK